MPTCQNNLQEISQVFVDCWEIKLRTKAELLTSLKYFHTEFLSLPSPHRLWTSAGAKPYKVSKARILLHFLSSQYPCGKLTRHWSSSNPEGLCTFPSCHQGSLLESPEHILLECPAYSSTRNNMISLCLKVKNDVSRSLISDILTSWTADIIMQFLLDCTAMPNVIQYAQLNGQHIYDDIFYLSRTWCFSIHRERMKRLGLWNFK